MVLEELDTSGILHPIKGVFPIAIKAQRRNCKGF